jgi:hypothetical protein
VTDYIEEATPERLREVIAEAYQVVGALAFETSATNDAAVVQALDVLSGKADGSMLPFAAQIESARSDQP